MPHFIDVGSTARALYIDIERLSCVRLVKEMDAETLVLHDVSGEKILVNKGWGAEPREALGKILAAHPCLIAHKQRFSSESEPTELFIAPEAVTFITTSQSSPEGECGIIAGIKGFGWLESNAGKADEVSNFVKTVTAQKQFIEFAPDEAQARWSIPDKLYIDPKSITRMRADSIQLNISFENSSVLDVVTKRVDVNDILEAIQTQNPDFIFDRKIMADIKLRADEETFKNRNTLADKLAAANGTLLNVTDSKLAAYVRPADINMLSESGDQDLFLIMKENKQEPMNRQIWLKFNTAAERAKVVDRLAGLRLTPPPKPSKNLKL